MVIMVKYISSHLNFNMLHVLFIFAVDKSKLFFNSVAVDLIPGGCKLAVTNESAACQRGASHWLTSVGLQCCHIRILKATLGLQFNKFSL